jgi:hypothetical protein
MRFARTLTPACVLALALSSCEKAPEPVASVTLDPTTIALPYPGFTSVSLDWQVTTDLPPGVDEPVVFLHLLGPDGGVERTFDHSLPFSWKVGGGGSYDLMLYQSALAPPLEEGEYQVTLGLYGRDGQRWALAEAGPEIAELEYQVGVVDTGGDPSAVPMFYFSPSWLPLEAGTDVQILGRRRLTDEGSIRVAEIPAEGAVWLSLRLSEPRPSLEELTLMEGEIEPGFTLSSSCGGDDQTAVGWGEHRIIVPVTADETGAVPGECEILIRPNFQIVEVDTLTRRSVGLEVLSWTID